MRILHVTRELTGDRRFGLGRSLQPLVDALRRAGHDVRYLTQEDQSPRAMAAQQRWAQRLIPWARRLFGAAGEIFVLVWLERLNMGRLAAKVAATSGVDAVTLHDPWIGWGFRLCRHYYRATRCRWGITEHGFGSYSQAIREEGIAYTPWLMRLNCRLEASVLRAAHWVICPTQAAREQLARDLALPGPDAHWHAVPHARPQLRAMTRADARAALGWRDDTCHVLAVGRLNPVKRFDQLVRACVLSGRAMHLTVLGEGDARALHHIVNGDEASRVTLEVQSVAEVELHLFAADVYVSSSRNESFGMANLEALEAGLPAICTAVGGVPEVTGGGAWLVPPGDDHLVAVLAQALVALIDNPQRRNQLAEAGRQHARTWPDSDTLGQRHEAIYRDVA